MNRKQYLNRTLCKHIMSHGYTCLIQANQVYLLMPFVTPCGSKGHQIVKIHNLAHAYRVMGY